MNTRIVYTKCYDVQLINRHYQLGTGTFIYADSMKLARKEAYQRYKEEIKNERQHILIERGYMVEVYNRNNICSYIGFHVGNKKEVAEEINAQIEDWKTIPKFKALF